MLALVLLLVASCSAESSVLNKIMLQLKITGDFEDVYDLLLELQSLNLQEQEDADARNVTEEAACEQLLSTIDSSLNPAYGALETEDDEVAKLQQEILDNNATILALTKQLTYNQALLERLKDERCEENEEFVQALIENSEGLDIIELLRQDISQFIQGQQNSLLQTTQLFLRYSSLFANDDNDFTNLIQSINDDLLNAQSYDDFGDELEDDLDDLLDKLEAALKENVHDLQAQEVKTTKDYAKYRQKVLEEDEEIAEAIQTRIYYSSKLTDKLIQALGIESTDETTYQDILNTFNAADNDCEQKRRYYASETARRADEDVIIAEAIRLFQTEFPELSNYVKQHGNGNFTESVPRRTSSFSFSRDDYQEAGGYTPL